MMEDTHTWRGRRFDVPATNQQQAGKHHFSHFGPTCPVATSATVHTPCIYCLSSTPSASQFIHGSTLVGSSLRRPTVLLPAVEVVAVWQSTQSVHKADQDSRPHQMIVHSFISLSLPGSFYYSSSSGMLVHTIRRPYADRTSTTTTWLRLLNAPTRCLPYPRVLVHFLCCAPLSPALRLRMSTSAKIIATIIDTVIDQVRRRTKHTQAADGGHSGSGSM